MIITRSLIFLMLGVLFCLGASLAAAANKEEQIFMDLHLMGTDLIDELVYEWDVNPPLKTQSTVTLVEIAAPVGLDDRFGVMVENRLYELLRVNPNVPIALAYCSICRQSVVKSTPAKTIMGRGVDQPEVLEGLLAGNADRLALSLVFEAEGRDLVLRAQIFQLKTPQTIVWAKTFSTSMAARRVLQSGAPLISVAAAREQQQQILLGRDRLEFVTRLTVRIFSGATKDGLEVPPLPFIEQSAEGIILPDRRTRATFTAGFTSIKGFGEGWSAGGHVARLLFANEPHLVNPDFYWTFGFQYLRLRGPGVAAFADEQLDLDKLLNNNKEPKAYLVAYRLGLETHVKYRFGVAAFMEYIPQLKKSELIKTNKFLGLPYQDYGLGIVVRW